jgi:hypothetical protein
MWNISSATGESALQRSHASVTTTVVLSPKKRWEFFLAAAGRKLRGPHASGHHLTRSQLKKAVAVLPREPQRARWSDLNASATTLLDLSLKKDRGSLPRDP